MRKFATIILIFLVVLLVIQLVTAKETQKYTSVIEFTLKARGLREQGDFKELDQLRNEILRSRKVLDDGTSALNVFYNEALSCRHGTEECSQFAEHWSEANPNSVAATIVAAYHELMIGAAIQETGWINKKSNAAAEDFLSHARKGVKYLARIKEAAADDPAYWTLVLELAALLNSNNERIEGAYQSGVKADPTYAPLYLKRAQFLLPHWGGQPGDVEKFANDIGDKLGERYYMKIAKSVENALNERFYEEHKFSWKRIKEGYELELKEFPSTTYGYRSYLRSAYFAQDRKTAQEILKRMDLQASNLEKLPAEEIQFYVKWSAGDQNDQTAARFDAVEKGDQKQVVNTTRAEVKVYPSQWKAAEGHALEEVDWFLDKVVELKFQGRYKELEKLHDEIVHTDARFKNGLAKLQFFYSALEFCPDNPSVCSIQMEEWRKENPKSAIPITSQGRAMFYKIRLAERSPASAGIQSADDLIKTIRSAWDTIKLAGTMQQSDAENAVTALQLGYLLSLPEEQLNSLFEKALTYDPVYEQTWFVAANRQLQRNPEKLEAFAAAAADRTRKISGEGMYSRIAYSLTDQNGLESLSAMNFDWKRIKKGYEDLLKQYPLSRRIGRQYLALAASNRDQEAAKRAFAAMRGTYTDEDAVNFPGGDQGLVQIANWVRGSNFQKSDLLPAIKSGNKKAAELALQNLEDINSRDENEMTALEIALRYHPEMVPWVIDQGVRLDSTILGNSPLAYALENKQRENSILLIKAGADVNRGTKAGTPLELAVKFGDSDVVKELLNRKDLGFRTNSFAGGALTLAIQSGNAEIVEELLNFKGIDTNSRGEGALPLTAAIEKGEKALVERLLTMGAAPDVMDDIESPMAAARRLNKRELVALLETKAAEQAASHAQ